MNILLSFWASDIATMAPELHYIEIPLEEPENTHSASKQVVLELNKKFLEIYGISFINAICADPSIKAVHSSQIVEAQKATVQQIVQKTTNDGLLCTIGTRETFNMREKM